MIGKTPNEGERLKRIEKMLENIDQQIDDMSERLLNNLEEELKSYLDLKLDELLGDITMRIALIPNTDDPTN
jgi:signal transduction protein with GAF and PtsI domain